ncbi:MAG: S8 family serine peptidase, partial [Gammaproteobacteria bacterium]|nr:S8 family serine peptidase [Gammaproteobacteria bacterium]
MDTLQVIKALRLRKDVLYAEPNYLRQAKQIPSDQFYNLQWHYPLINLPSAWDVSTGSSNVIVAVIDTGVLLQHPDLLGQFSAYGGYDFILNDAISQDADPGIDVNPDDPGDSNVGSSSFHGTHVAGTIAAATSFVAGGTGVAGIAPGVKIMPLRVLGNGGGTAYDILQAVRYAAGLSNDSGTLPPQKSDVINLSLGGGGFSQVEQDVYSLARNAGVIIVAASGNENSGVPSYPASYNGVISVGAVDINKQRAPYSNFGASVDVAAPGGDTSGDINGDGFVDGVLSTAADDSGGNIDFVFKFFQGTSMATPHMA